MKSRNADSKTRQILSVIGATLAVSLVLANAQSIYGLLTTVFPIGSTGVIASAGIKVYWESEGINEVSSINWGTITPGQAESVTVYMKNTGNVALTLSKNAENWNPAGAQTYMTLTWNYTGGQIQPNEVLPVTLTLTVSASITGITSFSFDIIVTGTEVP